MKRQKYVLISRFMPVFSYLFPFSCTYFRFWAGKISTKAKAAKYRKSLIGEKLMMTEVNFRNACWGLAPLDEARRLR